MLSFSIGAAMLILFPGHGLLLAVGAVFCGFSQGIFIPTASTYISNAVPPVATAFAAATFTVAMNLGQLISPTVLNGLSKAVFWKDHNDRRLCSVSGRNADSSHGHGLVAEGPGRIS